MAEEKKISVEKKVTADSKDVEQNKVLGILAYIGILFIIPLLVAPQSKFAKFHANQGCVLFIAGIICGAVMAVPILGWIAGFCGGIFVFILAIMGIINAANGKMEKLPVLGDFEIIK